jgi:PKD repeat protein
VANPGDKTIDELVALNFTVTATDADVPANTIAWSVDAGGPAGLTINASTGVASWTPTEAQGPGSYPVTFRATDNGTPAMSGTASITITVNEVNVAPVLAAISNKSVAQGSLLAFTATATDADIPGNTLAFSLDAGAPAGATINVSTGAFSWTPPAAGSFPITARVTDNGVPALSSSQSFTVTVGAVNNAPVLIQPSNMTVNEGATADQTLTATDPDAADVLTFSKVSGPAFMTVSGAGVVHLAPGSTDAGTYTASVKVSDNGTPSLSDTKSFSITVNETNRAPVANAGGPYSGSVGTVISFNGTGSSDPDGDALTYAWNFGDASTGTGPTPSHAYAATGVYTVSLTVTDPGLLTGTATTTATISDFFAANVFFFKNINYMLPQVLGSYIRFEPIAGSFNVNDVILSSSAIRLTYNGVTKNANCKNILDGDSNTNGIAEIRACFTQSDMKALFSALPNGTTDVTLTLEADLTTGGKVRGTTVAHVVKFSFLHAGQMAQVSPNPLNPQAKLSFVVTKPGVTTIQVFDINGRLVRNLMQRQYLMPGVHDVTVDGRNESGNKLASGVYYYRVQSADAVTKGSFIVMK